MAASEFVIFCDMDGVLCDFYTQVEKVTKQPFSTWSTREPGGKYKTKYEKWEPLLKYKPFWSTMPWMPGGRQLWSYIRKHDPRILSAYLESVTDPNCIPGKKAWLSRNVGLSGPRVHLVRRNDKQLYATRFPGKKSVLIDDFPKNITQFESKGGIGILHTNTSNTIAKLRKLGL